MAASEIFSHRPAEWKLPLPPFLCKPTKLDLLPCKRSRRNAALWRPAAEAAHHHPDSLPLRDPLVGRRESVMLLGLLGSFVPSSASSAFAKEALVGSYLPAASSVDGFVQFTATSKDTPALRAGNVQPYQFILPPTWKQVRIANILSGNYCQPKCAEPWVEVKFENAKQGTAQVFASPMVRLTNKPNAKIEEIGDPEKLISALGPFVTGNSYDPDEVVETHVETRGDQTYYVYALETPYAKTGTHNLAVATARGNVVLLFVVSATDSQWSSSQGVLRTVLESFQA